MKCESCRVWKRSNVPTIRLWGQCRRYAPRVNTGEDDTRFPSTRENDWCGEFATDEVIKPQNAPQLDTEKVRELIGKLCNYALRYGERHLGIEATSPEWLEKQFTNTKRELLATLSIE